MQISPQQITNWVGKHLDYKSRKNGRELLVNNPFDGDSGWHMNINTTKGLVHDWRPGHQQYDGSFVNFVQRYKKISFYEALRDICGKNVDIRTILQRDEPSIDEPLTDASEIEYTLPPGALSFRNNCDSLAFKIGLQYLESRGVTLDTAQKFDLHYGGDRIYFPYYEYGIQVYWQARTVIGKIFEFPSADGGQGKTKFLYGFDNAEPNQPLFITESIFNALTLGDGAVASGGADMSQKQFQKIKAINPSIVIFAPDRDEVGIMSAQKNAETLESVIDNMPCKFVIPPAPHKDWNDMWRELPRKYAETRALLITSQTIQEALEVL